MRFNLEILKYAPVFALAVALIGGSSAKADTFLVTFNQTGTPTNGCCGPFDVSAVVQATADGGNFDITSISGTVTQNGTSFAITSLLAPPNDPGGFFNFDNKILANAGLGPYTLDVSGIGFTVDGITNFYPSDPGASFNLWGNGGDSGTISTTASYDVNTEFNGTYTISAVPESSTWAMMILGFCSLGFMAYGRKMVVLRFA